MSRTIFTIPTLLLALCACGSPPNAKSPDGRERIPVNSATAMAQYQATARPSNVTGIGLPSDRVPALEQEVHVLRQRVTELEGRSRAPGKKMADKEPPRVQLVDGAEVEHRPGGLIVRMMHPIGQATFQPGPSLEALVLTEAAASRRIEVRGRTDAWQADPLNDKLAARRAALARDYLVGRGVPPATIETGHLAAGDFVADNRTVAGRARNRRVEIAFIAAVPAISDETAATQRSKP
ncbi:OmpA family protein [Duganella sp. BuS-21]|uniref:OmpA family protein n=1 Tax=Duganella sp. BuS-21 TaxID=2943848 RepID=UPI0035A6D80B